VTIGMGVTGCVDNSVTNNGTINSGIEGVSMGDNNTVVNNGTINADVAGIDVADNNTVVNNGTINSKDVGMVGYDNNALVNNGTINATGYAGMLGHDNNTLVNNGSVDASGGYGGIVVFSDNTVVNNGSVIGGVTGIEGNDDAQVVVNNGTITGVSGSAIALYGGNDSVVVMFGTIINGTIDGGADTDSFQINLEAYADDTTNATKIAESIAAQCPDASNCTISINGVTYVVMNFEGSAGTHIILLAPQTKKPTVICDGDVKVIKTVDGKYYDVYSGFSNALPNGFWVGRVDLAKLPGTLKFQDKGEHNPGWYVGVTLVENNLIVLQAHQANGTLVGKSCKVPR